MADKSDLMPLRAGDEKLAEPGIRSKAVHQYGCSPRAFPIASGMPRLPGAIRDEILDFYAFIFCQGGFRELGMTFEQFLLVVAAIRPNGLQTAYSAAAGG